MELNKLVFMFYLIYLFSVVTLIEGAYNPHGGLATEYISTATLSVSSVNTNSNVNLLRDGNYDSAYLFQFIVFLHSLTF